MIKIEDKSLCCGCWACYSICPKHCIEMQMDSEGFHYPVVDLRNCIDCGLCDRSCPINQPLLDDRPPKNYVVQHKDSIIRKDSTSGGFFTAISQYVIERGGIVFGAAFNEDMVLCHQYADTLEDCGKFRGSKYLQSLIGDAYLKAKIFLEEGKMVVFSGTPCQIAGLYAFLKYRRYERLLTIDLVCRGVPSPRLANDYFAYNSLKKNSRVVDYKSRDKYYDYCYSTATIFFQDRSKQYHKGKESDFMLTLYFKDMISRPSCYACHFKTLNRISDFTIFDCWDAPALSKKFDKKGATNVFIHTLNGRNVFEELKQYFIWSEADLASIIERDGDMIKKSVSMNLRRQELFDDLNRGFTVEDLSNKYLKKTFLQSLLSKIKPLSYRIGVLQLYLKLKKMR